MKKLEWVMKKLEIENISYEFNLNDSYTPKEGEIEYKFVSIKKVTNYKGNKKYQTITIKPEHLEAFKKWIIDVLWPEGRDEVPF